MKRPSFSECVEMLRSTSPMIYEDGHHWLQGEILDENIDELIAIMKVESAPDMRAKLVEQVGCSKLPKVIPVLDAELASPYEVVRSWAFSSLLYSENQEAIAIAERFRKANSDEPFL